MTHRSLSELLNAENPAWPELQRNIDAAKNSVSIMPPDPGAADDLLKLQITTHSNLGALVIHTGGLLIDRGWVRLLASYSARLLRSLVSWNAECGRQGMLLIGDDAIGGAFAINGGALGGPAGNVFYFAPDTMSWADMERGYSDFIRFLLEGDLEAFYGRSRWAGWEADVASLPGDRAFSIYPPLGFKGGPVDERSRRAVPLKELLGLLGALS